MKIQTGEKGVGYFIINHDRKRFFGTLGYKSYWDGGNRGGRRLKK